MEELRINDVGFQNGKLVINFFPLIHIKFTENKFFKH